MPVNAPAADSMFHAFGPDTANARAPKCVAVEQTTTSPRAADRSLCLLPTDVTGRQRSAMYDGASPKRVKSADSSSCLNTEMTLLNDSMGIRTVKNLQVSRLVRQKLNVFLSACKRLRYVL